MRSLRQALVTVLVLFLSAGTSFAVGPPVVVTGNGHSYAPGDANSPEGTLTVTPGSEVDYLNLADHDHTLTSVRKRNRRPLFDSGATSQGEINRVAGVAELAPGRYPFYCAFHDDMKGLLVVEEL